MATKKKSNSTGLYNRTQIPNESTGLYTRTQIQNNSTGLYNAGLDSGRVVSDTQKAIEAAAKKNDVSYYQQFAAEANRASQNTNSKKETETAENRISAFNKQYQPLTQEKVEVALKASLTGGDAFTRDYLEQKSHKAPWEDTTVPERKTTGNKTLDSFLAGLDDQKTQKAQQEAEQQQRDSAINLWRSGRQVTDKNGNTGYTDKLTFKDGTYTTPLINPVVKNSDYDHSGGLAARDNATEKRRQENAAKVLDAINYINARGSQALDTFNTNLNVLGEQAYAAIASALDTAKNTKQSKVVLPSLTRDKKPVFVSSTSGNENQLITPEEINLTSGASEGTAGQVKNAVRAASTAVLDRAATENRNAKTMAEVEKEFSASKNPVVHALGDLSAAVSGQVPYIAMSAATGILPGAALRGATSYVDAYTEARNAGNEDQKQNHVTASQAKKYATREAINQGIGDILLTGIGGTGKGILSRLPITSKVGKQLAKMYGTLVTSPAAKTAIQYIGNMLGEGVEEAIQYAVTVANKRMSYQPDAKINSKEMLAEGILGAGVAGILGGGSIPQNYQVYRSDVDTVNDFKKAADAIKSYEDAKLVQLNGDILLDWCNMTLNDPTTDFDTRARNEFIKQNVQSALDDMNANLDTIIAYNEDNDAAFDDAVDSVGEADADDYTDDVANLVTVVAGDTEPDTDVIRTTIDRVNEAIRNAESMEEAVSSMTEEEFTEWMRQTRLTGTLSDIANAARGQTNLLTGPTTEVNNQNIEAARQQMIRELKIRRALLDKINNVLRNQKSEVKSAVAGMLESPKTGLQNTEGNDIIVSGPAITGNPVVKVDGKSLIQTENASPATDGGTKYNLTHTEYTHTKSGKKMQLYRIGQDLSDEDYKALKQAVSSVGGYWNKFAKGFVVPDGNMSQLADALRKIGVGIDESQYKPSARTKSGQTPNESANAAPKIEVVNGETAAQTGTAERPNIPQFEVYESGGDLVPVNEQTGAQASNSALPGTPNTDTSVQGNASTADSTNTAAPDVNLTPASGTENARTPVNVNAPKKEQEKEPVPEEWKNAVRALGDTWKGIGRDEFVGALNDLYEAVQETSKMTADGKVDLSSLDTDTLTRTAMDLAQDMIDNASVKEDNPEYAEVRDARQYLRETPIYYNKERMIAEFGDKRSYNRWRNSSRGKLRLTTDPSRGAKGADAIFQEFAERFPGYVDRTLWNELDQLKNLADVANELSARARNRKTDVNPYEMGYDEAVQKLAGELTNEVLYRLSGTEPERAWNAKKPKAETEHPKTERQTEEYAVSPYDTVSDGLSSNDTINLGDYSFSVYRIGPSSFYGNIKSNSEDKIIFHRDNWQNRNELISKLVEVAKELKLFDPPVIETKAPASAYDEIAKALENNDKYSKNDFTYEVWRTNNNKYAFEIYYQNESDYGGNLYSFESRNEAISKVLDYAKGVGTLDKFYWDGSYKLNKNNFPWKIGDIFYLPNIGYTRLIDIGDKTVRFKNYDNDFSVAWTYPYLVSQMQGGHVLAPHVDTSELHTYHKARLDFIKRVKSERAQENTLSTEQDTQKTEPETEKKTASDEAGEIPSASPQPKTETEKPEAKTKTYPAETGPYTKIADWVSDRLQRGLDIDKKDLQVIANDAYGGTMAEGAYDVKDMTDALELGVNRFIIDHISKEPSDYNSKNPEKAIRALDYLTARTLDHIPTQTNRTEEQIRLQQFSTPPNIAFVANWVANITPDDTVLEPSAGIGGLASFAKGMGAKVVVNELSDRRLELLKTLPFDEFYHENAEQIDNILPNSVKPTVVVMNPPFSANGRTKNKTANAIPHIEQALERLEDGGRLVAILGGGREAGGGMSDSAPAFKEWWNGLRDNYDIRANVGIDGSNYKKYGTSFNVQLVVIDKTGPQKGKTLTGQYSSLGEAIIDLEDIRNDRPSIHGTQRSKGSGTEPDGTVPSGSSPTQGGGKTGDKLRVNSGKRDSDSGEDSGSGSDRGGQQPVSDLLSERGGEPDRGSDVVAERPGGKVSTDDTELRPGRGGQSVDAEPSSGDHAEQRSGGMGTGDAGDGADRKPEELVRPYAGIPGAAHGVIKDTKRAPKKQAENDDGVYASYQTAKLTVKNAKPHPAKLVESSAMSAVSSPTLTYTPTLDPDKIQNGTWSDAQLENICYAGQAHSEKLPDGQRKGYFIGDGTGVGKGRQLAGIIMDNFNQGRRRAIWISENANLMQDAKRDWKDIGGDPNDIFPFSDTRKKGGVPNHGIMFVPYTTLPSESQKTQTDNLSVIEKWFGKNFDGVIVFDEAHNLGNLTPVKGSRGKSKPSQKALAGNKLQSELPNARVVYASATGATKIENLAYASRLGLWGEKTAFRDTKDFISQIGSAGLSAMELVARDMKAMGVYLARSISYDGVVYDNLTHNLTRSQIAMYDRMSDGWQVVLQNFDKAMELTSSEEARDVKQSRRQIYGNMQLFYNQVLTSFATPSVINDIEKELAKDHSCVIQLVNTQESATKEQIQKAKEEGRSLDDVDVTPRQLLVGFVEKYFPIYQYEEYLDDEGNTQVRRVVDSQGNPVINKRALQMKEDLIADLNEISIPDGPLDMIINHFGTDNVAEITGRKQRLVSVTDESGKVTTKIDKRDSNMANIAETAAFQNGDKRILVFSGAGSTGRSFHADKRAKNQQQRIHYVLQPGWQADKAVQGFGRTHRSNQVSTPVFRLVRTDVEGHKRFVTSIARRLDQLGALTKGQRQTGSGVFGEKDNLESPLSAEALKSFYKKLGQGNYEEFDPKDILEKMGLAEKFYDDYDNFNPNAEVAGEITTFLNRLLALHVEDQNALFKRFEHERDIFYNQAIESGTLDTGLENVRADKIEIEQEDVVYTDKKTGAETKYVKAKLFNKPRVLTTIEAAKNERDGFVGIYRMKDGSVRAAYRVADATDARTGDVIKRYVLVGPNQGKASRYAEATFKNTCEEVPKSEWQSAWDEEVKRVPEYNEGEAHMITGALLPIWDKLPQGGNVKARRLIASDGSQYLGRVIDKAVIDSVLRGLNVNVQETKYSGKDLYDAIMKDGKTVLLNGRYGGVYTIGRRRVANETRIEMSGGNMYDIRLNYPDLITETIQYNRRYFIPTGAKGEKLLGELAEQFGVRSVDNADDTENLYSAGLSAGKWGKGNRDPEAEVKSVSDLVKEAQRIFGIPINTGRMNAPRDVSGMYKSQPETIRTRKYGDIPDIAHEVGHHFDKRYNLHQSPYIDTLLKAFQKEFEKRRYQKALYTREAVAEYFSAYMIDREKTEKKFRKFTDWLNQTMSETDMKKLNDFSAMSNGYFAADLERRADAQVHYRTEDSTVLRRAQERLDDAKRNPREYFGELSRTFVRDWFDDLVDLRGFGRTYDLAYYEKQARSIAYGRLVYGMTDNKGNVVGKSLAAILSDGNITQENIRAFDAYLIARVALDRLEAAESGEDVATLVYADEELGTMESLLNRIEKYERENPTFHDTAEEVYHYEHQLMDVAVGSGLVSEDLREYLDNLYPHYVPLYRVMDDERQKTRGAKKGYEGQTSPVGRFKGSGRDIYSPIENIILNTERYTVSAMRNDVMTEFADFVDNNEGMGWAAEKIPPAMVLDYISTDEIGKKIAEFALEGDRLDALSEKEKAEFYSHLMSFLGEYATQWKPSGKKGHNVVSVMRDGKVQYYEVHDPGVYAALTNMDAPQWDMLTKFFGMMTRIEKSLFTSKNPYFIFTNPQRDLVTGFVSSTTTDNPFVYMKDFIAAFADALRGDETYERYVQSGGGYMGSLTSDYNVLRRISKDVVKGNRSQIQKFGDQVAEFTPRLVDAGETASRLAEWKRAIAQGYDNVEAMRKAQEITVNFARGGRIVKRINQYIPFFQAGFSALAHDYDLFVNGGDGGGGRNGGNGFGGDISPEGKRRRAKAWAKWLATTALLALMAWLYNFLIAPKLTGESEEEVMQHWDDLSNYNKNAYYNVYIGNGKFIRWKKTQDMAIASSIVERMVEYSVLDQKDALNGMADYVFDNVLSISLNPVDILSDVTLIGPVVNILRNKDFKGTPIVSKSFEHKKAVDQYNDNTSTIAIFLGQIFRASPIKIQYLSESYAGSVARMVNNLTPYNGERSLGLKNKLIADSAYSTDIINNFYNQKTVYEKGDSIEDEYGAYKYNKVASLYSDLNTMTRNEPDNDLSRNMKIQTNALIQTVNEDGINELDRAVLDLAERAKLSDLTSIAPYIVVPDHITIGSGNNKASLPMGYDDMVLYYNQSQTAFETAYSRIMEAGYDDELTAEMLAKAKTLINNELRKEWQQRLVMRMKGE